MKRVIVVFLLLITGENHIGAQNSYGNDFDSIEKKQIEKSYLEKAGSYAAIYSGKEQTRYPAYYRGNPYFQDNDFKEGILFYDEVEYSNVRLRLDLFRNELLILSPNNRFSTVLLEDKLEKIFLNNLLIFYNKTTIYPDIPPGYYAELYKGSIIVLEKPNCTLKQTTQGFQNHYEFIKKSRFYIMRDNNVYVVNSKKSLLTALKSKKTELNQYIKVNNLNYKENPVDFIVKVVEQYEKLN